VGRHRSAHKGADSATFRRVQATLVAGVTVGVGWLAQVGAAARGARGWCGIAKRIRGQNVMKARAVIEQI